MKISCVSPSSDQLRTPASPLKFRFSKLFLILQWHERENDDSCAAEKRRDNDDEIWKFYDLEMQIWQLNFQEFHDEF